jgi:hypothetical protein
VLPPATPLNVTQRRGIVQRQHVTGYDERTPALPYGGGLQNHPSQAVHFEPLSGVLKRGAE